MSQGRGFISHSAYSGACYQTSSVYCDRPLRIFSSDLVMLIIFKLSGAGLSILSV